MQAILSSFLFLAAAMLYSSVGHGGASAYLAIMALMETAPTVMRPSALILNVLVAGIATHRFWRARHLKWSMLLPLACASVPCALVGATMTLSAPVYHRVLGAVLVFSAFRLWATASSAEANPTRPMRLAIGSSIGGAIGFVSGLIGIGGGIFLSPILLLMRWATPRQTSAVSAAFILVNSIAGLVGCARDIPKLPGTVALWGCAVVVGGMIGSGLGSKRLPNPRLRQLLAVVLVVAAIKLIMP